MPVITTCAKLAIDLVGPRAVETNGAIVARRLPRTQRELDVELVELLAVLPALDLEFALGALDGPDEPLAEQQRLERELQAALGCALAHAVEPGAQALRDRQTDEVRRLLRRAGQDRGLGEFEFSRLVEAEHRGMAVCVAGRAGRARRSGFASRIGGVRG